MLFCNKFLICVFVDIYIPDQQKTCSIVISTGARSKLLIVVDKMKPIKDPIDRATFTDTNVRFKINY